MNVLLVSSCRLDPLLGSGKTRLRWSEGLRALGHTVDVCEPAAYETWHGATRRAPRFRQAWGACSFVEEKLGSQDYDLIDCCGAEFGLLAWRLAGRRNRPLIVAHTDGLELLASDRDRAYNAPRGLRARLGSWFSHQTHDRLSRAAFVHADAFVALCDLDRDYVVSHGLFPAERTAVIEPGLDDEYLNRPFAVRRERQQDRVAFTGSWIARKGVGVLAAVMTNVLRTHPGAHFDVFGASGQRDAVTAALPADLGHRMTVHGRLSNEQLAQGLAQARVFFFPTQYEGYGMALAEAMACGCAVVTTRTGFGAGLRDGEEGLLCDFDDVGAMEAAICRLLDEPATCERIAQAGWARVQRLRWDVNTRKLGATYEQWVSEHQRRRAPSATAPPKVSA